MAGQTLLPYANRQRKADLQTPIADLYILLEYGAPKSARVFPGGHMGQTPDTVPTIIRWLKKELN